MRTHRSFWRSSALTLVGLALAGFPSLAQASPETVSPPLIRLAAAALPAAPAGPGPAPTAPGNAAAGNAAAAPPVASALLDPDSPFADLGALLTQQSDLLGPPYSFYATAGATLIGSDNVNHSPTNNQAGLISLLTLGVGVGAQTPRLNGVLSYRGSIRRSLSVGNQNRFQQFGAGSVHAVLVPDNLFVDVRGIAREIDRSGVATPDEDLLTNSQATQIFSASVTPNFATRVGTLGFFNASYTYGRFWAQRNTGAILTPEGAVLAPLSDGQHEFAQAKFTMPGTFDARLLTVLAAQMTSSTSGRVIGSFGRSSGVLIHEYQLTRSFSAIGSVGWEKLSSRFSRANGEGVTWHAGTRWRPNPDSAFLVLYGRQNLNNSVTGQAVWQITPLTKFFAAYTDSVGTSQRGLSGGGGSGQGLLLTSDGPSEGVADEDDPLIGLLIGAGLRGGAGGFGVPLSGMGSSLLQQNDIFRRKMARGVLSGQIYGESVSFTAFHSERESLVNLRHTISDGIRVAWNRRLSEEFAARANAGYWKESLSDTNTFSFQAGVYYNFSDSLNAGIRYRWLRRDQPLSSGSIVVNALILTIRKRFE